MSRSHSAPQLNSGALDSDRAYRFIQTRLEDVALNSTFAAKLYGALILLVVVFQIALAMGAPWGSLAMGGAFPGRLPPSLRVAAVIQALVLLLFAAIVAARAGVLLHAWSAAARKLIWMVVGVSVVSVVLNAITPSPWERAIWLPVTLALLSCALAVARGRDPRPISYELPRTLPNEEL